MTDAFAATLRDWQGFYQVLGESAATLTGLLFVSITLGARLLTATTLPLVRTFTVPVLGYFLSALTLSALMCTPTQTRHGLMGELAVAGLVGLWRSAVLLRAMCRHRGHLHLERRHWMWHLSLPAAGSLFLLAAALGLWRGWPHALDASALAVLLLVVAGVVNAWEMALQTFQSPLSESA